MKYPYNNIESGKTVYIYRLIIMLMSAAVIFYLIAGLYIQLTGCRYKTLPAFSLSQGIAEEIIRFHVKGRSNKNEDQSVKLLIKDEIINYIEPFLAKTTTKAEAESILISHIDKIVQAAQNILDQSGLDYSASASLSREYFPIKSYGDIVLPAGMYDSLIISLGEAKGNNWWCIMFPQLCFIDNSYSIVPDSSKAKLRFLLTEEEYSEILMEPKNIKYKSKLLEWLMNMF